jgi:uncharacterized protein
MDCLQYLWLALIGLGVGTLGTLIGAGGGFLLMPILFLIRPDDSPATLTGISIAVVVCNTASGTFWYARMKRVDFRSAGLFLLTGVPGAVLGGFVVRFIPQLWFKGAFGVLLIAAAAYIFIKTFSHGDHKHGTKERFVRKIVDAEGKEYVYGYSPAAGMALSFSVGLLSSMLGIGGGIVHVPAMVSLLNFPVHVATATSQFFQCVWTLVRTGQNMLDGSLTLAEVPMLAALAAGAAIGARVGSHLSRMIHGLWIMRILSAVLGLVGGQVLCAAITGLLGRS